ncbi:hypothetical protein BWI93_05660 [Siphonobacter sp. BAB-5385]|uniref:DUF6624 domain-containing protein n=1 Tax=unclassified Siphonobacter TaxID=2635712 RepID=UPI000B9E9977|nr:MULTISPECIES: DUF6624 domain-containing protein [unclassified Siphonobacter]OZI09117.1 hypothetical protein BWI93_05660 [Siphonobacter sp. BAB-5385]PMD98134.1 hypothetical protein BWI97_05465 [Siphonobacter sp. BAB-5405]
MKFLFFFLLISAYSYGQTTDYTSIKNRLLAIRQEDQQLREEHFPIAEQYGYNSPQATYFWKKVATRDSIHAQEVGDILTRYGWLSARQIGREANQTLFLVIQHANLPTMQRYLPFMQQAVREQKAESVDLAYLEDRVGLESNGKQLYGTQIGQDTLTKEFYVEPLVDPDRVDERRALMGLPALDVYTKAWGFDWDVDKHKKRNDSLKKAGH